MSDLISRQAAIDAIRKSASKFSGFMEMEMYTDDDAIKAVNTVPSAYPKKGKWIPRIGLKHPDWFTCSECTGQFDYKWKYCPNCGADMREES